MALTPAVLYTGGQLGSSAATLFTSATNTKTLITKATFTNTDTVARLLTVYLVRQGGSAATATLLIDAQSIPSKQTYAGTELINQLLNAGDYIAAFADAANVVNCVGIAGYLVS